MKNHLDMIGWETVSNYNPFAISPLYWDMKEIGDATVPGWIRYAFEDRKAGKFMVEAATVWPDSIDFPEKQTQLDKWNASK